jgi:hypothetical protein
VDPRWPAKPYVYIHAADNRSGNHIAISRFTLVGDIGYTGTGMLQLDVTSRRDLLLLPDDHPFHNGGTVRFGPDQRLYVSLGDDWFSCQAQDPNVAAGKILRLDVSRLPPGPGGPGPFALLTPSDNPYAAAPDSMARMMWIIGLRNPFRFHIDPATGDLFVADVGQETWEEVERFTAGGQNGGWPWREGGVSYTTCTGSPPAAIEPIAVYGHGEGVAIMSGGVYRGTARGALNFPAEYEGNYFFHDYFTGIMRRLVGSGSSWDPAPEVPGQPTSTDWATGMNEVTDVLEMPDGSLWYCRRSVDGEPESGEIRRIGHPNPNTPPPPPPAAVPVSLQLAVPQPTPSYGSVTLSWSQPRNGEARLVVYDIRGRVMRVLEDGVPFTPGTHASEWDGRDGAGTAVAPGLYLVQLTVGAESRRTRITLLR